MPEKNPNSEAGFSEIANKLVRGASQAEEAGKHATALRANVQRIDAAVCSMAQAYLPNGRVIGPVHDDDGTGYPTHLNLVRKRDRSGIALEHEEPRGLEDDWVFDSWLTQASVEDIRRALPLIPHLVERMGEAMSAAAKENALAATDAAQIASALESLMDGNTAKQRKA